MKKTYSEFLEKIKRDFLGRKVSSYSLSNIYLDSLYGLEFYIMQIGLSVRIYVMLEVLPSQFFGAESGTYLYFLNHWTTQLCKHS